MKLHLAFLLLLAAGIASHTSTLAANLSYTNQQSTLAFVTFTIGNDASSSSHIYTFNITLPNTSIAFGGSISAPAGAVCNASNQLLQCSAYDITTGSSSWVAADVSAASEGTYTVTANTSDNASAYSPTTTFTADWTAPTLSGLATWTGAMGFWAAWSTSESANSSLGYGETTGYGSYNNSSTMATSHNRTITGLKTGTTYYANASSCDAAYNCVYSSFAFATVTDNVSIVVNNASVNMSSTYSLYMNITNRGLNTTTFYMGANQTLAWTFTPQYAYITMAPSETRTVYMNVTVPVAQFGAVNNISILLNSSWGLSFANNTTSLNVTNVIYNFTLASITSPFKNFTTGIIYYLNVTINNTGTINDTYTLNYSMVTDQNVSWNVTPQANSTSLNYGASTNVTFYVYSAANASASLILTINATSSNGTMKNITIVFSKTLVTVRIPNDFATSAIYYWANNISFYTNATCEMGDNASGNNTGVVEIWALSYPTTGGATVATGTCINDSCNVTTSGITVNSTYLLTVYYTDNRSHNGSASAYVVVPKNISAGIADITANAGTFLNIGGNAYYNGFNSTVAAVTNGYLTISGAVNCSNWVSGAFSMSCGNVPSTPGTYDLTATISGWWGTTRTETVKLYVVTPGTTTTTPQLKIEEVPAVTLEDVNVTFTVKINNTYSTAKTFNLSIGEAGITRHFDVYYGNNSTNIVVGAYSVKGFDITLSPYTHLRPGSYTLYVNMTDPAYSREVTVVVAEPETLPDTVNEQRYIETTIENVSTVTIVVINNKTVPVQVNVTEVIPKSVAANVSEVTFNVNYSAIIQADPIVAWYLELDAGEKFEIKYSVNKSASNVTFEAPGVSSVDLPSNASGNQSSAGPAGQQQAGGQSTALTTTEAGGSGLFQLLIIIIPATAAFIFFVFFTHVKQAEQIRAVIMRVAKRPVQPAGGAAPAAPSPYQPSAPAAPGKASAVSGIVGKLKGIFSRKPSAPAAPAGPSPYVQPAAAAPAKGPGIGEKFKGIGEKLKNLFGKLKRKPPNPPLPPAKPVEQRPAQPNTPSEAGAAGRSEAPSSKGPAFKFPPSS